MLWCRPFSSDLPAEASGDSTFVDAWKIAVPKIDPPKTPSAYMTPRPQSHPTYPLN